MTKKEEEDFARGDRQCVGLSVSLSEVRRVILTCSLSHANTPDAPLDLVTELERLLTRIEHRASSPVLADPQETLNESESVGRDVVALSHDAQVDPARSGEGVRHQSRDVDANRTGASVRHGDVPTALDVDAQSPVLAEAPQPVHGSEVLCEACAIVFCPHGERLHFHHDGCPQCEADTYELAEAPQQEKPNVQPSVDRSDRAANPASADVASHRDKGARDEGGRDLRLSELQRETHAEVADAVSQAPKDVMDSLHELFGRNGISSYIDHPNLAGDVVHWACEMYRQSKLPASGVSQAPEQPKVRLMELARYWAQHRHKERGGYSSKLYDQHDKDFDTCGHPDCVLVRAGVSQAPEQQEK